MSDALHPLSELTTLHIGGAPADFIEPATEAELIEGARTLLSSGESWLILGGGSNTVAPDDGFDGTVLHVATHGIQRLDAPEGEVRLRIQAGESWDDVVSHAISRGWAGIESLSGIPGSTGAVPVQNVGAYGQEVSSALVAVDVLDTESLELHRVEASALGLGYRTSIFKQGYSGLITAVELRLAQAGSDASALSTPIAYAQVADALGVPVGERAPLSQVRESVLELRRSKGMLIDPDDPESVSAGSFFTNPIVPESLALELPDGMPRWPVGDQQPQGGPTLVKLSAAWLIEHTGIGRGFSLPGSRAAISRKHTLAIVNRGGATSTEIVQLATFIQARVSADFGINLQPEPVIL